MASMKAVQGSSAAWQPPPPLPAALERPRTASAQPRALCSDSSTAPALFLRTAFIVSSSLLADGLPAEALMKPSIFWPSLCQRRMSP